MWAFRKGFLMYQVDVRKVRAKMTSSCLPDNSRDSGVYLRKAIKMRKKQIAGWNLPDYE